MAPALRDPLISTREGRKIILNDEYRDLLEKIISKQYTTERAISEVKQKEALKRGGKVKKSSKSKAKGEDEDLDETEDEGEEVKTVDREHSESEEYPFVKEWQKAAEKEAEQQPTPQLKTEELNIEGQQISRLESKPDQGQLESKKETDLITELKTKGYAELPFEVALIKIEGKCYAINVEALHDLEQGLPEKWKDLETFLNKYGIIIPGEAEGLYVIPWKLLGRCNEWK